MFIHMVIIMRTLIVLRWTLCLISSTPSEHEWNEKKRGSSWSPVSSVSSFSL